MRVNAKAYREYSPLVRVNLTQLVANADIIVAIDQERVGCEIVWSTPNVFSTPATRWRHIPGSYSKALPASSFPTIKSVGLVTVPILDAAAWRPKLLCATTPRWHEINISWLAAMKLKANEDRLSGRWWRWMDLLRPLCDMLGNVVKTKNICFSANKASLAVYNKSWEGHGMHDLSVRTKF